MKKRAVSLLTIGLISFWATTASALPQDPDYPCFLIDAAGRAIDLGGMCPKGAPPASSASASSASASSGAAAKPKPRAMSQKDKDGFVAYYSSRYCEGRKRGMTNEQADEFAGHESTTLVMNLYGENASETLDDATVMKAIQNKNVLCPKFSPND